MNLMSATEEIAALQKALASAKNELVLVRSERDLLKPRRPPETAPLMATQTAPGRTD